MPLTGSCVRAGGDLGGEAAITVPQPERGSDLSCLPTINYESGRADWARECLSARDLTSPTDSRTPQPSRRPNPTYLLTDLQPHWQHTHTRTYCIVMNVLQDATWFMLMLH